MTKRRANTESSSAGGSSSSSSSSTTTRGGIDIMEAERNADVDGRVGEAVVAAPTATSAAGTAPTYVVELAKSGRAECKKCGSKIDNKSIRIGVTLDGDWGLFTRWQHLSCTIFHPSLTSCDGIEGFLALSDIHKQEVRSRYDESQGEVDEDMKPLDPEDLVRKSWTTPVDPCDDLLMPLLPYQKEGLGWMLNQEHSSVRGGILADEMGMGKTIQAVALILQNRPSSSDSRQMIEWKASDIAHEREGVVHCGTLIVLPTVAIRQWQMEIVRFTREHSLKVKIYHGTDRSMSIADLQAYDIILTSYKVLEIEYRKATAGTKVECRICGKKFYPEKLRVHRKYFCGDGAQRTDAQSKTQKKSTLAQRRVSVREQSDEDESDADECVPLSKASRATAKQPAVSNTKKAVISKSKTKVAKSSSPNAKSPNAKALISAVGGDVKARSTPIRGAAKRATSKFASQQQHSREDESSSESSEDSSSFSDDSDDDDDDDDDESAVDLVDESSVELKPKVSRGRKVSASRKRPSPSDRDGKLYFNEESDELLDSDDNDRKRKSSLKIRQQPSSSSSADPKAKAGKKVASKSSKVAKVDNDSDNEEDQEPIVPIPSSKRQRVSKGVPSKSPKKKRFPGELSSEDESDRAAKAHKRPGKLSARVFKAAEKEFYDEEVERDIRDAMKAHQRLHAKNAPRSLLHDVSWFRIILDEAHLIKDRSTSTAKAVFNLCSLYKWCLTGTPLQNRVGEIYSLIRFLRLDPHAFYFCRSKGCDCKSLHYRFTNSQCDDCGHSVIHHFCHFNKHILNPIQRSGFVAEGRKAMLLLKKQVLDEVLLRRTKTNRAEDISLPMRIVRVRQERMDEKEDDIYQALYTQSQAQFNTYLSTGTVLNNYAHIFDILIRLRQAVDHPYLVVHSDRMRSLESEDLHFDRELSLPSTSTSVYGAVADRISSESKVTQDEADDKCEMCVLCSETASDAVIAACGHCYCRSCLMDFMNTIALTSGSAVRCSQCEQPLTVQLTESISTSESGNSLSIWNANKRRRKSIIDKIDLSSFQTSTKMEALMEELYRMEEKDPGAKAIVFSQFVNMLDLLEYRLQRGGISCVKLSGSLSVDQRDKTISAFKEDPSIKVFLISLKAGGFALNLTVANYIFLMDPWWNPAAEYQAIDRTHRIGQYKPIYATRFIIEDSIEERILKLQEKKKLVFDGTVGGDVASMTKLTVDDMRFLFQ